MGIGETVTGLMWKASLGEERYFVALLISEDDSKEISQERAYCFETEILWVP
jgi:hypothetical protein